MIANGTFGNQLIAVKLDAVSDQETRAVEVRREHEITRVKKGPETAHFRTHASCWTGANVGFPLYAVSAHPNRG